MSPQFSSVIPEARGRSGNDPIFILNGEARTRSAAGESILNATIGALMDEDGQLSTMPTVMDTMARFQTRQSAGYAPI